MIHAHYQATSTWDLDEICNELNITRSSILDYYIKWDQLHLTYTNSSNEKVEQSFDPNVFCASDDFDWKRPVDIEDEETVEE